MNKTRIDWADFTWNPITGCLRDCSYCYARSIAHRFPKNFPKGFKPDLHKDRLSEPWVISKPSRIFVCSMADLFAPWVPSDWRELVIRWAWVCPVNHKFIFLTKDPQFIRKYPFQYRNNFWIGTTVTNRENDWNRIEEIKKVQCGVRFVSFEPLLGGLPKNVSLEELDWIVIGKVTGARNKSLKFHLGWVDDILLRAERAKVPVFVKTNISDYYPAYSGTWKHEFPREREN